MSENIRTTHTVGGPLAVSSVLPRMPQQHLSRLRLSQRLLTQACRLSLICAPAGYGKSALLNECMRQADPTTRLVWLDLLGHPIGVGELLLRLAVALQAEVGDGPAEVELAQLLARQEQPLWIVLDDYPRQLSAELDACLGRLLERAPHTVRWWVSGRRRPAWSFPRLLLQGDLLELDAQDLALDGAELQALLGLHNVTLASEQRLALLHSSEGWLAAICLLLLQGSTDNLVERLLACPPLLDEYIEREVLADLSGELQRALTLLANTPRFCAELCVHLLGTDAEQSLAELGQRQLLVRTEGRHDGWFRLPRFLVEKLKCGGDGQPQLATHARASRWFAEQGHVREAVEHALWAGQAEVAAEYLQNFGQDRLLIGENVAQFLAWRDELPPGVFVSTPRLVILQAWALILCARLDEVANCLAELARFLPQPDARRQQQLLAQYQTVLAVLQRQLARSGAGQHALEALAVLVPSAWSERLLCYQVLTQQALADSDLAAAQHYNTDGLRLARQRRNLPYEALLSIERVHLLMLKGETDAAMEQVEQALQGIREEGRRGPVLVRLLILQGRLQGAAGADEEAAHTLSEALDEAQRCQDAYLLYGYLELAELAAVRGEFDRAQQMLLKAERQMHWLKVPEVRYQQALQHCQGLLWLHQDEPDKALECFRQVERREQELELLAPSGFYDLSLRNRLALLHGQALSGDAGQMAKKLLVLEQECRGSGQQLLACEVRIARAEALLRTGQGRSAGQVLQQALEEVQRFALLRPLRGLLRRQPLWMRAQLPAEGERAGCLNRLEPAPNQSPLSKREEAVLQLIAQGHSNQQIAERLCVSLHTVKSHARHINVKLGVERRTQAVAHAKSQGWLT